MLITDYARMESIFTSGRCQVKLFMTVKSDELELQYWCVEYHFSYGPSDRIVLRFPYISKKKKTS